MTGLLELKEKLKAIYSHNEVFILPAIKFVIAFLTLNILNSNMGYMTQLDNVAIVLIVALMCSFLPTGAIMLFAALFSLLHMYALSLEVALIGFVVYTILFLLFLRFGSKDSLVVIFTPVLFSMGIPYVMPVAMGLLGTPLSGVTIACGVIIYYLLQTITNSAATIGTMGKEEATAKIRLIIDGLLDNKSMLVVIAAFVITVVVVYMIRRMSIDYSWTIAIIAGVMVDLVILLVGDLIYDTNVSVGGAIVGAVVTILLAKVIEFFRFCVDYSRTEKVQFEDDEYYYYVKVVPKMTVTAPDKTVKRINSQTRSTDGGYHSRTAGTTEYAEAYRRSGQRSGSRTVSTESTGSSRASTSMRGQSTYSGRRDYLSGGKSVTISSDNMSEDAQDDYEELF